MAIYIKEIASSHVPPQLSSIQLLALAKTVPLTVHNVQLSPASAAQVEFLSMAAALLAVCQDSMLIILSVPHACTLAATASILTHVSTAQVDTYIRVFA